MGAMLQWLIWQYALRKDSSYSGFHLNALGVLMENELLSEGEVREYRHNKTTRPSSDVVVLLELKTCNEPDGGQARRFLPQLLNSLEKELNSQKIIKNRYSLVVFGGPHPYDAPSVRTLNGQDFVPAKDLESLLSTLSYGEGKSDVTGALHFASQLNFRPGVSKTFLLVPCSGCESIRYYGELLQSLLEQDATLHVLTDAEFRFSKQNASRQFLGLDAKTGYTSKESKGRLLGDADMRRQARLPKSVLGVCAPLALETNGTIFVASRMRDQRKSSAESKRAMNVWVRRVAATAGPSECHQCTCVAKNQYQSALDCQTCSPRTNPVVDISFLMEDADLARQSKAIRSRSQERTSGSDGTTDES